MSYVVFGATGNLGRQVLAALQDRGVPADQIVATGRDLSKLGAAPVRAMPVDYADEPGIRAALKGARKVLLISTFDIGRRIGQHTRVINAARDEGVELLAYTSSPQADRSTMAVSEDHAATEKMLTDSGVPFTVLRNGMYLDLLVEQTVPEALQTGEIVGASGTGRLSPASRADLAAATAAVLTEDGHADAVYELGGDDSYTMAEVAAAIATWSGRPVEYRNTSAEEFSALLTRRGLPEPVARLFADTQDGMARNEFHVTTGDLGRLIGRPTTSLANALTAR